MKIKKKSIFVILTISIIIFCFSEGRNYYNNKKWYDFNNELKEDFPVINKITMINSGPHCIIHIYTNKSNLDFITTESIFKRFLNSFNQQDFFSYFKNYHEIHASGELVFIDIVYMYKNEKYDILYDFQTYGTNEDRYGTWVLSISKDKKYQDKIYKLTDYK